MALRCHLVIVALTLLCLIPVRGLSGPEPTRQGKSSPIPQKQGLLIVTIRPMTPTDATAAEKIEQSSFTNPLSSSSFRDPDSSYTRVVAVYEGSIVGYLLLRIAPYQGGAEGLIESLAAHPDYRHLGVGTQLLDYAKSEFVRLTLVRLRAAVPTRERIVQDFFRVNGFRLGVAISAGRGNTGSGAEWVFDRLSGRGARLSDDELRQLGHYDRLGLIPDRATPDQIRKAFESSATTYHDSEAAVKLLAESRDVLLDTDRKEAYDFERLVQAHRRLPVRLTPDLDSRSFYAVLGATRFASWDTIVSCYIDLRLKYKDDPGATQKIQVAFEGLQDPILRDAHDRKLHAIALSPEGELALRPGFFADLALRPFLLSDNYYEVLGVSPRASRLRIQVAYVQLMRTFSAPADRRRIQLAYDTLMFDESRAAHDSGIRQKAKETAEAGWSQTGHSVSQADPRSHRYYQRLGRPENEWNDESWENAYVSAMRDFADEPELLDRVQEAYFGIREPHFRVLYDRDIKGQSEIMYPRLRELGKVEPARMDYYDRLGASEFEPPSEILSRVGLYLSGRPGSVADRTRVEEALMVLTNPVRRAQCDAVRQQKYGAQMILRAIGTTYPRETLIQFLGHTRYWVSSMAYKPEVALQYVNVVSEKLAESESRLTTLWDFTTIVPVVEILRNLSMNATPTDLKFRERVAAIRNRLIVLAFKNAVHSEEDYLELKSAFGALKDTDPAKMMLNEFGAPYRKFTLGEKIVLQVRDKISKCGRVLYWLSGL